MDKPKNWNNHPEWNLYYQANPVDTDNISENTIRDSLRFFPATPNIKVWISGCGLEITPWLLNVQGKARTEIENAFLKAGYFIPNIKAVQWYRKNSMKPAFCIVWYWEIPLYHIGDSMKTKEEMNKKPETKKNSAHSEMNTGSGLKKITKKIRKTIDPKLIN